MSRSKETAVFLTRVSPRFVRTLLNTLPHGLYHASGDVYLNAFPVPKNQDYVLLIDGNLHIMGQITIPADAKSTFTVSASGTIYIDYGGTVCQDSL